MTIHPLTKPAFSVIGKEGSTADGPNFIPRLWADANGHFSEIAHLAKHTGTGALAGIWGAMTDLSRTFRPWQNDFTEGLYLAGVECRDDAEPPADWTKWTVPGFEYLVAEASETTFPDMLRHLRDHNTPLAGAVHDFTDPATGKSYMLFPIRKL